MKQYGYANNMVLPHGNYLINLGNPDRFVQPQIYTLAQWRDTFPSDKREKSYECFLDDLQRCEELGLELYNFQYASLFQIWLVSCFLIMLTVQAPQLVQRRSKVLSLWLRNVSTERTRQLKLWQQFWKTWYGPVITHSHQTDLLTQAGAGNVIGSKFSDLAGIIAKVEDKTRVGVCLDTCRLILFVFH